jgi:hypothetical protein
MYRFQGGALLCGSIGGVAVLLSEDRAPLFVSIAGTDNGSRLVAAPRTYTESLWTKLYTKTLTDDTVFRSFCLVPD